MAKKASAMSVSKKLLTSAQDDIWTMFQTLTVRDIAKRLNVDRRTVQRWKNQGMQPKAPRRVEIYQAAKVERRQFVKTARTKHEHLPVKKLAVPLKAVRSYPGSEVTEADFKMMKARSKTDPKFKYDLFKTKKDKKGVRHYFRYQPAGTFMYDVRRARDQDIVALILAHRGEGRNISAVYVVTREYEKDDGTIVKVGTHNASPYARLDSAQFSTAEGIKKFLSDWRSGRRILFIRFTD